MSPEINNPNTKVCPNYGTRINDNATRCLVCGKTFSSVDLPEPAKSKTRSNIQGPRMPEVTLSLPIAIGLIILILGIGAAVVFAVLSSTGQVVEPTITPTPSLTPTITTTPTSTATSTPEPTWTPLPPLEYTVSSGDMCAGIAAFFGVNVQSIVIANNLPADCGTLFIGQKLKIPQPTLTPSPMPTATLSGAEATDEACEKLEYTVTENDTISGIAANYSIAIDTIKQFNGLTSDIVYSGQKLTLPLCQRLPTPGPTPTATLPPPYPAPNLLLPPDGAPYGTSGDTITLQWAAVSTLRENETYEVVIEDVTEGQGRKLVEYVKDTKFIVPTSFRPSGDTPHVIRWYVSTVRQVGNNKEGLPLYDSAGAASDKRTFTWAGNPSAGQ